MANSSFELFLEKLVPFKRIIIQPHDFPDHDAIASAFAMQYLLRQLGYQPLITYKGYIDRISLRNMIKWLSIDIKHPGEISLTPDDKIIVVDGCIGEKNVTDMPGLEVCVIDHHQVEAPDFVWYSDIREDYGSTATIIFEYFQYFKMEMPKDIATALLAGLTFDTNSFSRGVGTADIRAMLALRNIADLDLANRIFRNQLEYSDLNDFKKLLHGVQRKGSLAYCILPQCEKNMLGVLGDFLLGLDEVDTVILVTPHQDRAYFSLRSECPKTNVAKALKVTLNDRSIGFGGGHRHMAGGVLTSLSYLGQLPGIVNDLCHHLGNSASTG